MSLRNRKLVGWKIWFGDGVVLDSRFNKWEECQQKNVQVVKLFFRSDTGIEINLLWNQEYYLLEDLLEVPKTIKLGRAIDADSFYRTLESAKIDESIITTMK